MQKDKTRDKLLGLLAQGKKYTQGELAKELGVRQSAISKQLKRMEKRGWIMGHGATSNRYFELTKNGISAAQNPSQNGISRASKPKNGISYTGNVFLVVNVRAFRELIEGVVNLGVDRALLKVGAEGIEIRQMDPTSIAMIVARISKAQFISYEVGNPENIGIDTGKISSIVHSMPGDKELIITVSGVADGRKLRLECEDHVSNILIEKDIRSDEKEPVIAFKATVEIDGKLFQKKVHDMANELIIKIRKKRIKPSHITFKVTKENLILTERGGGGDDSSRTFDKSKVKIKADDLEQSTMCNMTYIENMLGVLKKGIPATIQLTAGEPVKISYHMDGVDFAYYLAPYMENE